MSRIWKADRVTGETVEFTKQNNFDEWTLDWVIREAGEIYNNQNTDQAKIAILGFLAPLVMTRDKAKREEILATLNK